MNTINNTIVLILVIIVSILLTIIGILVVDKVNYTDQTKISRYKTDSLYIKLSSKIDSIEAKLLHVKQVNCIKIIDNCD
jgi:cell division protein FtsX